MNKPELSIDGILSYQHDYKTLDELYSAFAYLLKQLHYANKELTEEYELELVDEQVAEMYYQMVDLFAKEIRTTKQVTAEALAFFLEHDIAWFSHFEQEAIKDGAADFLEAYFKAQWSKPDIDFLLLFGSNGYALRIETGGVFQAWFSDVAFLNGEELPYVEKYEANTVRPPELPEEPTKGIRRKRKKKEDAQRIFFESGAIEKEIHERLMEEYSLKQGEQKKREPELSIETNPPAFVTDDSAIHAVVKSLIGEVVMSGSLVHPLTPAEWQEVYDVLFGAATICVFGNNDKFAYVPTIRDIAEGLYNDKGTEQVTASLYLLSQHIHALQSDKRVERVQEVTALLRYYDRVVYEDNTNNYSKVNDTLRHITATVLSDKR